MNITNCHDELICSTTNLYQTTDFFGSRLANDVAAATFPSSSLERLDQLSSQQDGDITGSSNNNQFANRQGQLLPSPSGADQRQRLAPRPQQAVPLSRVNGNQQQQQRPNRPPNRQQQAGSGQLAAAQSGNVEQALPPMGANQIQPTSDPFRAPGVDMQPRFQRLRTPPGGNGEQFLNNNGQQQQPNLIPLPAPQFGPSQRNNNNNQQSNNGLPTLSAFDLTSLANLANQQQFGNQQQQPQAPNQVPFRRLPPPQQQQQQQQQGNNNQQRANQLPGPFQTNSQQVPNNSPPSQGNGFNNFNTNNSPVQPFAGLQSPQAGGSNPTELPFIRQVFRPSIENNNNNNGPEESSGGERLSGSRPTPPPLFVPGRSAPGSVNKVSRLVESGGFSPIQSAGANSAPLSGREVFFEPNQSNNNQQNRLNQQRNPQQQPPVQRLPPNGPSITATAATQTGDANRQPVVAADLQQANQAQDRRKPPARRPSQRPQLPVGSSTNNIATANRQQPGFEQASQVPRLLQQQVPAQTSDVIRLASSAIATANEGLAAISMLSAANAAPQPAAKPPVTSTDLPPSTEASSVPSSPSSQSEPAMPTSSGLPATEQPGSNGLESGNSRRAAPPPLRTSANFFTLTSASTSSPTSFSPALPINAAVAASGGRRRIPVRQQQQQQPQVSSSTGSSQATRNPASRDQFGSVTTQSPASNGPPITTLRAPAAGGAGQSVRRPEIEEFYETIGNGFSSSTLNSATTIDGFGAPSRSSATSAPTSSTSSSITTTTATAASTTVASSSTTSGDNERAPITTTSGDFYGNRLVSSNAEAPVGSSFSPEESSRGGSDQAPSASTMLPPSNRQPQPPTREAALQPVLPNNDNNNNSKNNNNNINNANSQQAPVMVPVTYMTTLTYLTTVLHGTHTLETSHESLVKSTELATLNAQLMDQIEHKLPLIEPTATMSLSSKTKGKGTTIINLKSAVSAYNQELVEALGVEQAGLNGGNNGVQIQPTAVTNLPALTESSAGIPQAASNNRLTSNKFSRPQNQLSRISGQQQQRNGNPAPLNRGSRTIELSELAEAKKSLLTELVYSYTMKPVSGNAEPVTSVRSEIMVGQSVDGNELMGQLMTSSGAVQLIDSNGLLRINQESQTAPVNLGKFTRAKSRRHILNRKRDI